MFVMKPWAEIGHGWIQRLEELVARKCGCIERISQISLKKAA